MIAARREQTRAATQGSETLATLATLAPEALAPKAESGAEGRNEVKTAPMGEA